VRGEGVRMGYLMYPLKSLHEFGHKNAIRYKNMRPRDFLTALYTLSKEFEND
jgi:hypothetical protein